MIQHVLIESLWLLIPLVAANMGAGVAKVLGIWGSETSTDTLIENVYFGILRRDKLPSFFFGPNKNLAAFYAGPFLALLALHVEWRIDPSLTERVFAASGSGLMRLGICLALGAVCGDHVKSLLKRQRGIPPGVAWRPWDSIGFALGSFVVYSTLVGWKGISFLLISILLVIPIHFVGNLLGHRLGLRAEPI